MKLTHYIYLLGTTAAILTACNDDDLSQRYTVGEADNAIVLGAGIGEGGSGVQTRAGSEDNHNATANGGGHKLIEQGVKLRLQVSGVWKGKSPEDIVKTTTATVGVESPSGSKHNEVTFTPAEQLYWDDYGTADPDNMPDVVDNGRAKGLTIYGAAINDKNVAAPTVTSWTAQSVSVEANQTSGWTTKDYIISNNVKDGGVDGTYKFDDRASGKLLEFRHVMSMITVNLTAGEGFVDGKFVKEPSVILHKFPTSGTIDITSGVTSNAVTITDVTTFLDTPTTWSSTGSVKRTAIVFPTRDISTIGSSADDYIAKINADDNIYYVTKDKLLAAMGSTTTMESGKNYILNVKVNKTKIEVTATIVDWIDVMAEEATPKINVVGNVGIANAVDATKDVMDSFDFYLSDAKEANASTLYTKQASAQKPSNGADGVTIWPFKDASNNDISLYWPNHQIHYFMRGVSPASTTVSEGKIAVTAGIYNASTSPSNLLVGAPVITTGTMCGNEDHTQVDMSTGGICAREGKINLTFDYMMSQVEVRLTTVTGSPTPANAVNLTNAKVEIVGGYTSGEVDIHAKTVSATNSVADFEVEHVTTEADTYRHSIVVPQAFTNTSGELKFKITIYKNGDTTQGIDDIFYAPIKDIKVTEPGDSNPKVISSWESGKHYVYTLNLEKTEIKVTATITDWVTVTASEDVWF